MLRLVSMAVRGLECRRLGRSSGFLLGGPALCKSLKGLLRAKRVRMS